MAMPPAPGDDDAPAGHTQHEDNPWTINIPDHPKRADSPIYVVSRKLMNDIVKAAGAPFISPDGPYQDHHGGGLWVKDAEGWFLVKNVAGMEWSQQFCADPSKVEVLRKNAERLYAGFPLSIPAMEALVAGKDYPVANILATPINDPDPAKAQALVSRWVDSIFNASVPLHQSLHTGALKPVSGVDATLKIRGGVHHYPTPITDIQLFKYDDFQLWVVDAQGQLAAVTPAHPRGSSQNPAIADASEINVAYATPGTELDKRWLEAHEKGDHLTLSGASPLAAQAFAAQ